MKERSPLGPKIVVALAVAASAIGAYLGVERGRANAESDRVASAEALRDYAEGQCAEVSPEYRAVCVEHVSQRYQD